MTDTTRIDAILAGLPADQRAALQHLRATIAEVAPDAVEAMATAHPRFATATIRWSRTRRLRPIARSTS